MNKETAMEILQQMKAAGWPGGMIVPEHGKWIVRLHSNPPTAPLRLTITSPEDAKAAIADPHEFERIQYGFKVQERS